MRMFCEFLIGMEKINSMLKSKVCSEDVGERVERIWWLKRQPAMTDVAQNRAVGEMHATIISRGAPSKTGVRAVNHGGGLWIHWTAYLLFPLGSIEFVGF